MEKNPHWLTVQAIAMCGLTVIPSDQSCCQDSKPPQTGISTSKDSAFHREKVHFSYHVLYL